MPESRRSKPAKRGSLRGRKTHLNLPSNGQFLVELVLFKQGLVRCAFSMEARLMSKLSEQGKIIACMNILLVALKG
jgi:hypothetical protein